MFDGISDGIALGEELGLALGTELGAVLGDADGLLDGSYIYVCSVSCRECVYVCLYHHIPCARDASFAT